MTALKRRTRAIIFRLTDDEYDALKTACAQRGARTVSDFARTELLRSVALGRKDVTDKLTEIESGVQRLERMLQVLGTNHGGR
jgi:uncharacterized protein (DUF1778 family)